MSELTKREIERIRTGLSLVLIDIAKKHDASSVGAIDELNALCDLALRGLDDAEDAERYRWMRESQSIPADILINHHNALDAAIDAALTDKVDAGRNSMLRCSFHGGYGYKRDCPICNEQKDDAMSKLAHSNQETMDQIEAAARKDDDVEHCQCDACVDGFIHNSDCSVHNMPAMPNGPCDCGVYRRAIAYEKQLLRSAEKDIATLREQLAALSAQPQGVPVARVKRNSGCGGREFIGESLEFRDLPVGTKLYTAPPSGVREPDAAHLQTIDERDAAEEAVSDIYYRITGRSPEWSNLFGFEQAIDEIQDAFDLVRAVAKSNTAPQSGVREGMLLDALQRAQRVMHGEGVEDQGEAWDKCAQILDEAITRAAEQVNADDGYADAHPKPFYDPSAAPTPQPADGVVVPSRAEILGALARGYCHEGNTHKQMDVDLLNMQADELVALLAAAKEPRK